MDNDLPIRQPISVTTREPKEYYNKTELLTYEYLLEIFEGDGSNVVNPLVNRCIIYENKIEELQKDIACSIGGLFRFGLRGRSVDPPRDYRYGGQTSLRRRDSIGSDRVVGRNCAGSAVAARDHDSAR